jgi:chromosome segregation ATPase
MDMVLKKLEERIEQMIQAHEKAKARETELMHTVKGLEGTIGELEGRLKEGADLADRTADLERQKLELAERLESVISKIDTVLETKSPSDEA